MEAFEYSNPPHSVSKQNIEVFTWIIYNYTSE